MASGLCASISLVMSLVDSQSDHSRLVPQRGTATLPIFRVSLERLPLLPVTPLPGTSMTDSKGDGTKIGERQVFKLYIALLCLK